MYLYLHLFDCEITDTINKSIIKRNQQIFSSSTRGNKDIRYCPWYLVWLCGRGCLPIYLLHILSWQYLIDPILYDCILVLLKRWHNKCKNSNIRNKLYNCSNLLSFQCCYSLGNWWLHVLVHIFVHSWSCFT